MLIKPKQFTFGISQSVARSSFQFKCGESPIEYTDKYKYLGLVLNEHLDYNITAKYVAQSATRALGLLISKFKQTGGMPFEVYKKLFDSSLVSDQLRSSYLGYKGVLGDKHCAEQSLSLLPRCWQIFVKHSR